MRLSATQRDAQQRMRRVLDDLYRRVSDAEHRARQAPRAGVESVHAARLHAVRDLCTDLVNDADLIGVDTHVDADDRIRRRLMVYEQAIGAVRATEASVSQQAGRPGAGLPEATAVLSAYQAFVSEAEATPVLDEATRMRLSQPFITQAAQMMQALHAVRQDVYRRAVTPDEDATLQYEYDEALAGCEVLMAETMNAVEWPDFSVAPARAQLARIHTAAERYEDAVGPQGHHVADRFHATLVPVLDVVQMHQAQMTLDEPASPEHALG